MIRHPVVGLAVAAGLAVTFLLYLFAVFGDPLAAMAVGLLSTFLLACASHRWAERRRLRGQTIDRTLSLLRSTVESTADGILVVDRDGKIVLFNRRFAEMWRIPGEILETRDDDRAISFVLDQLKDPDAFVRKVRDLYATPEAESFDILEFKDGRVFERISRPQILEGEPIGRVWSFHDVTDRKRAEEGLEAAVKARDIFLSIASHELKTPLTALQLQAQALLRTLERGGALDGAALRDRIEKIDRQGELLSILIDELLDVSRITAGRLDLAPEEIDLAAEVRSIVGRLAEDLHRAGCPIEVVADAPVTGRWDRLRIDQVVTNLLSNAIKYGAGAPIRLEVAALDGHARLAVRDEGIGIPREDQDRIFERFERAGAPRHQGGLGLGLYIARAIVRAHGGEISVESEPGRGSTFTVTLPRRAEAEVRPVIPARPAPGGRILLVEDDPHIRDLLRGILRDEGYAVDVAADGQAALDAIRAGPPPALVLLDLILPRLDGVEVIRRIRADPALDGVPVVTISADDRGAAEARAAGAGAHLPKPISMPDLLQAIRRHAG